jgi:hypothetical protein
MINERRGPARLVDERAWRARWIGGAAATFRAACFAGAAMHHATLGLGAVRLRCLLAGHDDRLKRLPNRLFLRCEECGRVTCGWTIAANAPRLTAPLITRQPPVVPFRSNRRRIEPPTLHLLHHQSNKAGFRS